MGWFKNSLDKLREAASSEPVQCPRGWGEVSFNLELEGLPPYFFGFSRTCPIGGVTCCTDCNHPFNPEDIERLREQLTELENLRDDGVLSESEYAIRRQMIIELTHGKDSLPGEGFHTAAWILGPLAAVIIGAGIWLAQTVHRAFYGMVIGGAIVLALSLSFAIVASTKRKMSKDLSSSDDPFS